MKISKIKLSGKRDLSTGESDFEGLKLEATYSMGKVIRGGTSEIYEVELGPDKVAEFTLDDNTVWICDAGSLHDLFPESELSKRGEEAFVIPDSIKGATNARGILGDITIAVVRIFTRKVIPVAIKEIASKLEDHHLKSLEGLYRLDKNFGLQQIDKNISGKSFLLFLHGTNSSVTGAFGDLKDSEVWRYLCETFGTHILAFQHRTLTESPLQNAVALADALPSGIELHLISHSRGGLIGDILCRYDRDLPSDQYGFSASHIELLKKEKGRDKDIENIKQLNNIFLKKKIKIKKFIRVACPAAGTILVSGKLENIFNILFNLGSVFVSPAAAIAKGLISEILKTKDNVNSLPGIEAMSPSSPFIKILNDRSVGAIIGDKSLIVISGNSQASISLKGLMAITTRLFFGQRNDMVVNTDSMYLGVSRSEKIHYFFDEGPRVAHTQYFSDETIREVLLMALKSQDDTDIPGFTSILQLEVPGTDRGIAGLEYGELTSDKPSGKKPIVVLIPGIMGSNLKSGDKTIWINYLKFLTGGLTDLEDINDKRITAASIIKTSYKNLKDRLSHTYDVVVYPFDWRKQLNVCAAEFNDTISELMKLNQPIKLIGHSMGGVLIRDFIITHNDTWQQLNSSPGFRVLFLGSPLGGSFRIPAVLFGEDAIIDKLSSIDLRHTKKELLMMFSQFPGILSLLPLNKDGQNDFTLPETWEKMREAFGDATWPIPGASVLNEFKAYRDGILAGQDKIDYSNMVYIAGKDKATPCGYYNDMIPPRTELVFLCTGEGDQSVTWESGIPKQLIEKEQVYYVNVTHGALANEPSIFDGIEEILGKGKTDQLSTTRPTARGEETIYRLQKSFDFDNSETGVLNSLLGLPVKQIAVKSRLPLTVSISNGDLKYASYPVFSGHFKNDGILFAEKSIDKYLHGKLSNRNHLGIYPGDVGTNDIFLNPDKDEFKGAVIVGLGEPGALTAFTLSRAVEQGASNLLLNENNNPGFKNFIGISSVIIGCGFGGLSIETSIRAIIEGVNNANLKIAELFPNQTRRVEHIEFIELYKDKALNCMYALSKIYDRENSTVNIRLASQKIKILPGAKERLPVENEDSWWNRISVRYKERQDKSGNTEKSLVFGVSTLNAREEERELFSNTALANLFIDKMSTGNQWDAGSAKTIFELLIPNEFKERLMRKGNINWILDKESASYPWELLQESTLNSKPLCVNGGMIRQLSTPDFNPNIRRVVKDQALIVGDPLLNGFINQLPGAEKEAREVANSMNRMGYANVPVINSTADEIIRKLFSDEYKVIHLAGHGIYNPEQPGLSGMVIGEKLFLSTADIAQMSTIPELVFINCCFLGRIQGVEEKYYQNRYRLAANIGTQLIEMGVKAVIAAGWAVDDRAAATFATRFYEEMFGGVGFGDAVRMAREEVYEKYNLTNNTWGAYQCYGDPFYRLVRRKSAAKADKLHYLIPQQAEIDLNNLISDLETGTLELSYAQRRVAAISEAVEKNNLKNPELAEKIAIAYGEMGDCQTAVNKYDELFLMENAQFSVSALEKHCDLSARIITTELMQGQQPGTKTKYLTEMDRIIHRIEYLLLISPTEERYSLLGNTYKRKAVLMSGAQRKTALKAASFYYYMAFNRSNQKSVCTTTNWFISEAIIRWNDKAIWKNMESINVSRNLFVPSNNDNLKSSYNLMALSDAIKTLDKLEEDNFGEDERMDYLQLARQANISLCRLILQPKTNKQGWGELTAIYHRLWAKNGSQVKKKIEMDNLKLLLHLLTGYTDLRKSIESLVKELEGIG